MDHEVTYRMKNGSHEERQDYTGLGCELKCSRVHEVN